jgi:thiamine-phosphate pyrophosphorylase
MQIYALCDATTLQQRNKSLKDFVSYASKHNTEIIQYRNKDASFDVVKTDLLKLRQLWDGYLIINDYIELVPFCDGLHLGQEDLGRFSDTVVSAVSVVRKKIGKDKIFGISTHNMDEILEANESDLNYIGLGAFRQTSTKNVDNILGSTLDELASHSKYPVGAIGGVKLSDTFNHVKYLVIGSDLYEN